jgi:hypothetical protein
MHATPLAGLAKRDTVLNSTPIGSVIDKTNDLNTQPSRKLFELKVPPCSDGEKAIQALPIERYSVECEATTLALMPSGERAIVGCSDGSVRIQTRDTLFAISHSFIYWFSVLGGAGVFV